MKYIHKYKMDNLELFVISESAKKPSGKSITIPTSGWVGYGLGSGRSNALNVLEGLTFTKEPPEKEEEPKQASISTYIRDLAEISKKAEDK